MYFHPIALLSRNNYRLKHLKKSSYCFAFKYLFMIMHLFVSMNRLLKRLLPSCQVLQLSHPTSKMKQRVVDLSVFHFEQIDCGRLSYSIKYARVRNE